MAISIYITDRKTGKRQMLYEEKGFGGKKRLVPLYRMLLKNASGHSTEFAVTRDTVVTSFGHETQGRYGTNSEVPPNRSGRPYGGLLRADGPKGFRIQLFERGFGSKSNRHALRGIGRWRRTYIQIHMGPGTSEGCILLTGGVKGRMRFEKTVLKFIAEDKRNRVARPHRFEIWLEPRV